MTDALAHPKPTDANPGRQVPSITDLVFLITRTGFEFAVRPVVPFDEPTLADLFSHVDKDDIRFRFLSPRKPGHEMFKELIDVDHDRKESYLAIAPDGKTIIANAMVAADAANECAEVAIAMHRDYKGKGVGWALLKYIVEQEKRKGVKKLQSIESRENHEAIELEREMGFRASSCPGDASLMRLEFDLTVPAN
ncbi:MAG: GNAT family N-acetyltransferase [Sphingomonadaceae bacterium]|jgi:GNAT superfamily N-acetyltransferase